MTLDDLHEKLSADIDESLERRREGEAEMGRKFPGYPPYLNDATLQKIEMGVEAHAAWLHGVLTNLFGQLATAQLHPKKVEHWMRELAKRVAHQAAGHMGAESALQADRASHNTLMAALAGVSLGTNSKPPTHEEGTTDAGPET